LTCSSRGRDRGFSAVLGIRPEGIANEVAKAAAFVRRDEAGEFVVMAGGLPEFVAEERVERGRKLAHGLGVVAGQQPPEASEIELASELVGRVAAGTSRPLN
jgi:hypothetical protein